MPTRIGAFLLARRVVKMLVSIDGRPADLHRQRRKESGNPFLSFFKVSCTKITRRHFLGWDHRWQRSAG